MREDYYAEYAEFEENNWWFVSRRFIIRRLLAKRLPPAEHRRILDAGCGTGINLAMLREFGDVDGIDSSAKAVAYCGEREEKSVRQADLLELPLENDLYDLVTALDVLEHIQDDAGALAEIVRVCRPGGRILLTVPAFPGLWGDHDVVNQHVRRYSPSRFYTLVEESGLTIEHRSGMNLFLFPAAFLWRTYRRLLHRPSPGPNGPRPDNSHRHPIVNGLLRAAFTAEAPLITGPGLPPGLSVLCVAVKEI